MNFVYTVSIEWDDETYSTEIVAPSPAKAKEYARTYFMLMGFNIVLMPVTVALKAVIHSDRIDPETRYCQGAK